MTNFYKEKRLFVSTVDTNLYTHLINMDELQPLVDEDLFLVESVFVPPAFKPAGKVKKQLKIYFQYLSKPFF